MFYNTVILCSLFAQISLAASQACQLDIKSDFGESQGLLLKPGNYKEQFDAFYHPDQSGILRFQEGETLVYECPGGSIIANKRVLNLKAATLTCSSGKIFDLAGKKYYFVSIACNKKIKSTARYTGQKCLGNYKEVEIGFELQNNIFVNHITLCFDEKLKNALYSTHKLTKSINNHQIYRRPDFVDGGFCGLGSQIKDLYTRTTQRDRINDLVGLPKISTKYIHKTDDYYLARGHFTPMIDFLYGPQEQLTFYFINAAPQWQTLNAGNWLALENSVRKFSSNNNLDLIIYTGTNGVSTLPHEETGEETELYLYGNGNDHVIPVPQLFWKVVYEPVTKKGIAFIGLNNPHVKNPKAFIYCTDICNQINWITWKANDIKAGYSYCCSVPDFRNVINTFPQFEVNGVLK